MYANYHTHTVRCGHASDSEEEYIKIAMDNGIKIMGFSEHAPFLFPDGYESPWRLQTKDAENYIYTIKNLKEKYKDKIQIHIGFEMEYYPLYFDDMFAYVKKLGAEYLILGQHYIGKKPDEIHVLRGEHTKEMFCEYTDCVIKAIESKKFLYVAHPDVFFYPDDDKFYKEQARKICEVAKKNDIPLEINFLGIYYGRHYPDKRFIEVMGEVGCKVIFGFDAHSKERAFDESSLKVAKQLVEKYNLNLVDSLDLTKI